LSLIVTPVVGAAKPDVACSYGPDVVETALVIIAKKVLWRIMPKRSIQFAFACAIGMRAYHRQSKLCAVVDARIANILPLPLANARRMSGFTCAHSRARFGRLLAAFRCRADSCANIRSHRLACIDTFWHSVNSTSCSHLMRSA
jgi:hypothetical protein